MSSLRTRLLVVAALVLTLFLLLATAGLEQAFQSAAQEAQRDKLQGLALGIMGAADLDGDEIRLGAANLPDPRFGRVQSGLEALIFNERGKVVWRSPSFSGQVPKLMAPEVGEALYTELDDRLALTYGLRWVGEPTLLQKLGVAASRATARRYTIAVLVEKSDYLRQLGAFRRQLWLWLGGAGIALIGVQLAVLSWGLNPLRRLVRELRLVESGDQSRIESGYPDELRPLAEGLNTMIAAERNHQTRYRNALDDLAHSLKTPLAVVRGVIDDDALAGELRERLREPVDRMQEITGHQLRKAAAAGRRTLAEPVRPKPLVDKIVGALIKVYAAKGIRFAVEIPDALRIRADEGDLYELLGNLLDNAAKWCKGQVRIEAQLDARQLSVSIHDDGPGFPADAEKLLTRGARADQLTPGQGIGLGAAAELVKVYDGDIALGRSERLGGGRVALRLTV